MVRTRSIQEKGAVRGSKSTVFPPTKTFGLGRVRASMTRNPERLKKERFQVGVAWGVVGGVWVLPGCRAFAMPVACRRGVSPCPPPWRFAVEVSSSCGVYCPASCRSHEPFTYPTHMPPTASPPPILHATPQPWVRPAPTSTLSQCVW